MAADRVAEWFARNADRAATLEPLRQVLTDGGLVETFKWRSPCYLWDAGNVATLWALKESCAVGFFKGVLFDRAGLVAPGEHSRSMRVMHFADAAAVAAGQKALADCVAAAIEVEKAGLKVEMEPVELDWPEELVDAVEADEALGLAFEALTPGRRRGWLLHFSQAKQSATRAGRIDKARAAILAGRGMHDR